MPSNNGTMTAPKELELTPALLALIAQQQGGQTVITDDDVQFHPDSNKAIVLPQGMTYQKANKILTRKHEESQQKTRFRRVFGYRPDDGAHAVSVVLKRMFGITVGKEMQLPFGMTRPPEMRTIHIGPTKTIEVPWGLIEIPAIGNAEVYIDMTQGEFGPVLEVSVDAAKMFKIEVEAFLTAINDELRENSIYRGKALEGAYELKFMDTSHFDPSQIVFSDEVTATLDGGLFAVLRYEDSLRAAKIPTKRSVLLYGPFGTGKSSIGLITAQVATRHGWTFLSAKAGRDNLMPVLQTAKLYSPAVVFVEDIDVHTPNATDKAAISQLLDLFDGIASKGDKLLVVMTTNHIKEVPKGMLRPGRLDFAIPIDGLDRGGVERLIKAVCPAGLLSDDIDYDAVFEQMDGFQPAWVKAVADRAKSFAIDRHNGDLAFTLNTSDLVHAARSLHAQLNLMNGAGEGAETEPFAVAYEKMIRESGAGMQLRHVTGDVIGTMEKPPAINASK